jgi:biotin synthase-like enzyme
MPQWYGKTTSRNTPMTDIFLFEGLHYFHLAYEGCDLFSMGQQCKFCSTGKKWHKLNFQDVGEVINAAYSETPNGQVCLGGGTHWKEDKGTKHFVRYISEIRKRVPNIPIWVEMVPPDKDEDIQKMIDSGATSFQFNIEIWDDAIRKQVCPGKSGAVSKERYFKAFKYVNQVLGPNKIGSMLIVGLEPLGRTLDGINMLIENGVKPGVAPFRPWDGAIFQSHAPASPEEVIEASRVAARQMREFGVNPAQNQGCSNCHACAIEDDYYEYMFS